jgi:hypothetical protein
LSEVLIDACKHGKYAQQQKQQNEEEENNANDNDENNIVDDSSRNPLQHVAAANLAAMKKKLEKEHVGKRGPVAAAAAVSQRPKFSKSVSHALAMDPAANPSLALTGAMGSVAEFTTIESLITAYSFDYVAVSALDIAPGANAHNPKSNCDDAIYDLGTMQPVILTQRKRHVPFKHSAIPIWTLPSDELPHHRFIAAKSEIVPALTGKERRKQRKRSKSKESLGSRKNSEQSGGSNGSNNNNNNNDDNGNDLEEEEGDPEEVDEDGIFTKPISKNDKKGSIINKGNVTSKNCKTAEEIAQAVAEFNQTKSPVSGCHRMIMFTLRKERPPANKKNNKKNKNENNNQQQQQQQQPFQLTYEPTIIFCFLSSMMRRGKSQLDSTLAAKDPDVHRAIQRDHKEIFQCLEHVSKYDGMGREQCMLQPYLFEGALTNLLSTYAWLRADCCRTLMLSSVKAFSESPDETSNVLADADRVKRYPVHPRASTTFASQGLPSIELPPLVAKQAEHILGKNIIAASSPKVFSPRSHPRQLGAPLSPSPPKSGKNVVSSPRNAAKK